MAFFSDWKKWLPGGKTTMLIFAFSSEITNISEKFILKKKGKRLFYLFTIYHPIFSKFIAFLVEANYLNGNYQKVKNPNNYFSQVLSLINPLKNQFNVG